MMFSTLWCNVGDFFPQIAAKSAVTWSHSGNNIVMKKEKKREEKSTSPQVTTCSKTEVFLCRYLVTQIFMPSSDPASRATVGLTENLHWISSGSRSDPQPRYKWRQWTDLLKTRWNFLQRQSVFMNSCFFSCQVEQHARISTSHHNNTTQQISTSTGALFC